MGVTLPILALLLTAEPAPTYPKAQLRNDHIIVNVNLPDAKKGFYRGSRFDWAGVIGPVEINGRKIFVPWKDKHDPANNDDIVGPCEEFGMDSPLGYNEAAVGQTFLKIGVGALVKPKEDKYRFYNNYEIKYPGEWQVTARHRDIEFKQELLSKSGYGYRYTKKIVLEDTNAQFVISHELTNSGNLDIDTDVYNHNFFNVDNWQVGPEYSLYFNFPATAHLPKERFSELVNLSARSLSLKKKLDTGSIYSEIRGLRGDVTDHRFTMSHSSGVRVLVEGNTPIEKLNVWGIKGCLCPEPYTRIQLKPGETKRWMATYTINADRFAK